MSSLHYAEIPHKTPHKLRTNSAPKKSKVGIMGIKQFVLIKILKYKYLQIDERAFTPRVKKV